MIHRRAAIMLLTLCDLCAVCANSNSQEQFAEYVRREIARWRKLVAAAKLKPQ